MIKNHHNVLLFYDSIGLGFFTVVGIQTRITLGLHSIGCIALGTITACSRGVTRDISLSNIPLIFQKEIYAITCILGGVMFFIVLQLNVPIMPVEIIYLLTIVVFRLISVKFNWHLPTK